MGCARGAKLSTYSGHLGGNRDGHSGISSIEGHLRELFIILNTIYEEQMQPMCPTI
jgi:hypothetical protein